MNKYKIDNNKIVFEDGHIIEFENIFRQTLAFGNVLIVIVEVFKDKRTPENVYCIDLEKQKIKWQIEDKTIYDHAFTDMKGKDKMLYLRNWGHYTLKVNPITGEIFSKTYDDAK